MRNLLCPLACGIAALWSAAPTPVTAATFAASTLADSVPYLGGVRDLGRAPQGLPVSVAVTLAYRHNAELASLIELQADPASPAYHRFLSNAQFAAYFGPTPAAYAAVGAALVRAGFRITSRYANDTVIDAVAPAAVVERYFTTQIHAVMQADAGERYANVTPATLPQELRGTVSAVTGLTNIVFARPQFVRATAAQQLAARARGLAVFGSHAVARGATASALGGAAIGGPLLGPDSGYGPAVVADAYDLPVQHGYNGAGRATAVEICGDYANSDLTSYLDYFGITRSGTTTRVEVDGGAPYTAGGACSTEATLDVETIVGLAPGTQLYMYVFPDLSQAHIEDGYNRTVSDNVADVVNSSFSGCEIGNKAFGTAIDLIAAQGSVKGITFAAASGDTGSTCSGTGVDVVTNASVTGVGLPASAPYFTGVGGTSLYVNANGSYKSEVAWGGSTGGFSVNYDSVPTYQAGVAGMIAGHRNVPDIAFPADPATGTSFYSDGAWRGPVGGTSWASPVYSALQTEVDQRRDKRFGHANPAIYAAAAKYGAAILHDITSGCNGAYCAHAGYDNVTGLGSLQGYAFSGDE